MDPNQALCTTCTFRGIEYIVSMSVDRTNSFSLEVEDKQTTDQWRSSFDEAFVEDLTHKTGNYKQFSVFVSMIESALKQTSDAVALDLLTYSDLESLRNRKVGQAELIGGPGTKLSTKRYLIVTYSVEFDRIHYPLPIPYVGKPDPRQLQDLVRQLKKEIKDLKHKSPVVDKKYSELERDYQNIVKERDELEEEFVEFKREMKNTKKGTAAKEIKILKTVIKNLEEDLMNEKMKHQKSTNKRSAEYKQLQEEVEELRVSERNLRIRVKNLTNELASYKRTAVHESARSLSRPGSSRSRTGSRPASRRGAYESRDNTLDDSRQSRNSQSSRGSVSTRPKLLNPRDRSSSAERSVPRSSSRDRPSYERPTMTTRLRRSSSSDRSQSSVHNGLVRDRSTSRDRVNTGLLRARSTSWERNRRPTSTDRKIPSQRSRTPSPAPQGGRNSRFNPTEYVKEQEKRKQEAKQRKKREVRRQQIPGGSSDRVEHRRPSPRMSLRNKASSIESLSDINPPSDSDVPRAMHGGSPSVGSHNSSPNETLQHTTGPKMLSSTPDKSKDTARRHSGRGVPKSFTGRDYYDRSQEISEIDERLNKLQKFLKANMA